MTDPYKPLPLAPAAPIRSDATFGWSAAGNQGNRYSTEFGGPNPSSALQKFLQSTAAGGMRLSSNSLAEQAAAQRRAATATNLAPKEAVADLGKTHVQLAPSVYSPTPMAQLKPPGYREIGLAEGVLGGLVSAFTGVLPGFIRDPTVRVAQLAGEALDVPLGFLGHVPVNELLGLENTKGAFELLPMTEEKRQVMASIQADSVNANWYMAQYLRMHQGDYMAAKGLPQALGGILRPDATIIERALGVLGLGSAVVNRTMAGVFDRAHQILNDGSLVEGSPLFTIRQRYLAGEFGQPGSQQALDRFTDEISTAGFGWSNDPFIGMIAEMVTDPVIIASMGTGLALKAVRVGALADRAAIVGRLARTAAKTDAGVASAVTDVENLLKSQGLRSGKPFELASKDSAYRFSEELQTRLGGNHPVFEQAMRELNPIKRAEITMTPVIETLAKASELLNSPFRLFGGDHVAGVVMKRFARNTSQGALAAFDIAKVAKVYRGLQGAGQGIDGLNEALGYALGHAQRTLIQNSLIKQLRTSIKDAAGKVLPADWMPDALGSPDKVVDGIMKDGKSAEHQQMEGFMRRVRSDYQPQLGDLRGKAREIEYQRQMDEFREKAAQKLAFAGNIDIAVAREIMKGADQDVLALADWAQWGRTLQKMEDAKKADLAGMDKYVDSSLQLARAPKQAAGATTHEAAAKAIGEQSPIVRATLVGPKDLTLQQAEQFLKDIAAAPDEAAALKIADDAINNKEYLYQNLFQKTRITTDADLIARVKLLLEDGIKNKRFIEVISPDELTPELKKLREEAHLRGNEYEIGVAPAQEARWSPVIDPKTGHLIGYYPWMENAAHLANVEAPTRFDVLRERIWQPVRAENILQESRRTFISQGVRRYNLDRASAIDLFEAIRKEASDHRTTMRSFSPDDFRLILDRAKSRNKNIESRLNYRGLAELTARALESDVKMVGLSSKLTGQMKTQTAAYGNFIGQLSEKVYPLIRFNLNPLFLMQEWIEPYFFNVLRGVKLGVKYTDDDIKFHNLMDEWNSAAVLADGFEAREFMTTGAVLAQQGMGTTTRVGRLTALLPFGRVSEVKKAAYVALTKQRFGQELHQAFDDTFPGEWAKIQAFFNELDTRAGGKGNLSEGEVATRYYMNKGMNDPGARGTAINHYDGAIPDNMGRIPSIHTAYVAQVFGYDSGTAMRQAIMTPGSGIDEWSVRNDMVRAGYTPEYAQRAWQVLSGIQPEELYDSIRAGYADPVVGNVAAGQFKEWAELIATMKGISPEEYIARKFTQQSVWLGSNAKLPFNAYTQIGRGMMQEAADLMGNKDWKFVERTDPRYQSVLARAKALWPETPHDTVPAHVNAARRAGERLSTEGMGGAVPRRVEITGVTFDPDLTMSAQRAADWTETQLLHLSPEESLGAGGWYPDVGPMFLGYFDNVPDDEILKVATTMNQMLGKKGLPDIDLTDPEAIRQEVTARAIMAWGSTQIQTSPKNGFGFILRAMDELQRGRRPDAAPGFGLGLQTTQIKAMLVDFEKSLSITGLGAKLHDFIDSLQGNRVRTFMKYAEEQVIDPETGRVVRQGGKALKQPHRQTYRDHHGIERDMDPAAMDIWMGRARGLVDAETMGYLIPRLMQAEGLTEDVARYEVQKRLGVWIGKVPDGEQGVVAWTGSPTPEEYESMLLYYNRLTDHLNEMEDGQGWLNKQWTVADVQAVEWVRIQKALGIEAGGPTNMFGAHAASIHSEWNPGQHMALRDLGLDRLSENARDYVIRTVDTEIRAIVAEETGVTFVRYMPGWQNTDEGVVSANSTWSIIGKADQIDDAMRVFSLLTQQHEVIATRLPNLLPGSITPFESTGNTIWALDFVPDGAVADHETMELLRIWLNGEARATDSAFHGTGTINTMRPDTTGALRVMYENAPKGTRLEGFIEHAPIPEGMAAKLADGTWIRDLRPDEDPVVVTTERRLQTLLREKNDYAADATRAQALIAKGADHDATYAAEMGKRVQARITKGGRDDIRTRVVGRHIPAIRSVADDAARRAEGQTWAAGRGRLEFLGEGGGGTRTYYQRDTRGWRGATQWNRRRDTTMAVADGRLGGSRGSLYFRSGRPDITTPVHEFFHFFADDLDPSAIERIHDVWWDSLTPSQQSRRTKPTTHTVLERNAEEWISKKFEEYTATGLAPDVDPTLNAVFNAYAQAWQALHGKTANVKPEVAALFNGMTREMHRGPSATFHVDHFRMMEAARIALQKAEEEAFRTQFYKRGRSVLERSVNHPYLGLYPASYMWGKVLPELMRFLVKKPFGVDAPFAGMAMANHVWNAIQLEMNTDDGAIKNLVLEFPELLRFLQLMIPGTPWDIPVNVPAWARRVSQGEWTGQPAPLGQTISDSVSYAFGSARAPADLFQWMQDLQATGVRVGEMVGGTYKNAEERKKEADAQKAMERAGTVAPPAPVPHPLQYGQP